MITKKLICIGCPMGCQLEADVENTKEQESRPVENTEGGTAFDRRTCGKNERWTVLDVRGNTCPRGADYARKELTHPTRIVTTTVRVEGGTEIMLPVKTAEDIPKGKIMDCMRAVKNLKVQAPVAVGDVILRDAAGTGVNLVAAKTIEKA